MKNSNYHNTTLKNFFCVIILHLISLNIFCRFTDKIIRMKLIFLTQGQFAMVDDEAAVKYFGEYANLNFK